MERLELSMVVLGLLQTSEGLEKVMFMREAERDWRVGSEAISSEKVWQRVVGRRSASRVRVSIVAVVVE